MFSARISKTLEQIAESKKASSKTVVKSTAEDILKKTMTLN